MFHETHGALDYSEDDVTKGLQVGRERGKEVRGREVEGQVERERERGGKVKRCEGER